MLPVDPIPFKPLAAVSGPAAQELRHSRERSDTGVIRLGGEDTGSFLHPQMMREDRGYVIAGLYQDVHMNVASGIYDQDGALLDRYWIHSGPVSAYLSVRTGPDSGYGSHADLARLPLPDVSGRIVVSSDDIDANPRAAVLHVGGISSQRLQRAAVALAAFSGRGDQGTPRTALHRLARRQRAAATNQGAERRALRRRRAGRPI